VGSKVTWYLTPHVNEHIAQYRPEPWHPGTLSPHLIGQRCIKSSNSDIIPHRYYRDYTPHPASSASTLHHTQGLLYDNSGGTCIVMTQPNTLHAIPPPSMTTLHAIPPPSMTEEKYRACSQWQNEVAASASSSMSAPEPNPPSATPVLPTPSDLEKIGKACSSHYLSTNSTTQTHFSAVLGQSKILSPCQIS
jgi:hypothetical protein